MRAARILAVIAAVLLWGTFLIEEIDGWVTTTLYHNVYLASPVMKAVIRPFGQFGSTIGITTSLLAILILDRKQGWRKFVMVGMMLILVMISAFLMKSLVGRERPRVSQFHTVVHGPGLGFQGNARYHSYPSGHTMAAFTLAVGVACAYRWATIPMLVMACLTGLQRIFTAYHFPSDVFAGAILGTTLALGCYLSGQPHTWVLRFQAWVFTRLGWHRWAPQLR